jgi:hypothetical protein
MMWSRIGKAASFRCTWIIVVLTLAGCGKDPPLLAPIKGSVTQGGKPLAEAKIVLHPLDRLPVEIPKPIAYTDESGQFEVTSLTHGDGALPGKYTVTVELRAPRRAGEEMIRDGKNLLPARFSDASTSGITKEVVPGGNNWDPIEIPSR